MNAQGRPLSFSNDKLGKRSRFTGGGISNVGSWGFLWWRPSSLFGFSIFRVVWILGSFLRTAQLVSSVCCAFLDFCPCSGESSVRPIPSFRFLLQFRLLTGRRRSMVRASTDWMISSPRFISCWSWVAWKSSAAAVHWPPGGLSEGIEWGQPFQPTKR